MRQATAKSIDSQAYGIASNYAYPFPKRLARVAKRAYNATPRPLRSKFSVRDALVTNK